MAGSRGHGGTGHSDSDSHLLLLYFILSNHILTVFQESNTGPTVSFINRPLQTGYGRNGVHEFVLGPKLSIGDLGLAQIPIETDFYVVDLEKVNRQNR